jgi:hypothetical protein
VAVCAERRKEASHGRPESPKWSCPGFVDTYPLREEEGVYDAKDTPTICS